MHFRHPGLATNLGWVWAGLGQVSMDWVGWDRLVWWVDLPCLSCAGGLYLLASSSSSLSLSRKGVPDLKNNVIKFFIFCHKLNDSKWGAHVKFQVCRFARLDVFPVNGNYLKWTWWWVYDCFITNFLCLETFILYYFGITCKSLTCLIYKPMCLYLRIGACLLISTCA